MRGLEPGPEASVRKAIADEHGQHVMALAKTLAGTHGLLVDHGPYAEPDAGMWNYGYLYPPSIPPWGTTGGVRPYVRHGKGGDYSWADGHVSMTSWKVMSKGANGKIDWFYLKTPDDRRAW